MNEEPPLFIDHLRQRTRSIPVTLFLVLANALVFVAMLWAGAGLWHTPNEVQLAWGANFGPATKDGEWWRLATAMFLHFGLLHLSVNMLALLEAGRFVERFYGYFRFLMLYLCAGLGGNLLSLVVQGSQGISGGASGAIFGLYAALLIMLWRQKTHIHHVEYRWLFGGAAGFTAMNLALGMVVDGIDNAAHVGGLVSGGLAALWLDPTPAKNRLIWRSTSGLVAGCWIVSLIWILPKPAYDWSDEMAARKEIRHFAGVESEIGTSWEALRAHGEEVRSFDELADRFDAAVTLPYAHSFDDLATLDLDPRAPSVQTLLRLRHYAEVRRDASHELSNALRDQDPEGVQRAMEKLQSSSRLLSN